MASPLLLLLGALLRLVRSAPSASNGSVVAPTVVVTVAAVLPERNLCYLGAWPRVGPALNLSVEALEPELRPAGLAVRTVFASSTDERGRCSLDLIEQNTHKLRISAKPDALLGLDCDLDRPREMDWTLRWERPLLWAGYYRSRPYLWTSPVYAGPDGPGVHEFAVLLHQRFNWTSRRPVSAVSRKDGRFWYTNDRARVAFSQDFASLFVRWEIGQQPDEALQFIQDHARVAYLQGSPEVLLQMLRLAQAKNMTSGDYVFIYLDLLGESLEAVGHREAAKPWQSKEGRDQGDLQEAFQTVLIITAYKPQTPEYRRFQSELILRAQRDFGVALNDSQGKNLVAGCFHDVLLLYIRALNETLQEGGTKQDTERILEKMRRLKIKGVTGTVSLNEQNERETDFDLWSMADVESGQYQVVARYVGSEERIEWLGPIHWKEGSPPLDNPPCVFDMDDPSCDEDSYVKTKAAFFKRL